MDLPRIGTKFALKIALVREWQGKKLAFFCFTSKRATLKRSSSSFTIAAFPCQNEQLPKILGFTLNFLKASIICWFRYLSSPANQNGLLRFFGLCQATLMAPRSLANFCGKIVPKLSVFSNNPTIIWPIFNLQLLQTNLKTKWINKGDDMSTCAVSCPTYLNSPWVQLGWPLLLHCAGNVFRRTHQIAVILT